MTGTLNPKSSEIKPFVFTTFVVYLSHGIFHSVSVEFTCKIILLEEELSSQIEEPQKKSGAPLSQHASKVCT